MRNALPIAMHADIELVLVAHGQPPWPHHWRHRHRQDGDPATHRRAVVAGRCTGVPRRCRGGFVRPRCGRRGGREIAEAAHAKYRKNKHPLSPKSTGSSRLTDQPFDLSFLQILAEFHSSLPGTPGHQASRCPAASAK